MTEGYSDHDRTEHAMSSEHQVASGNTLDDKVNGSGVSPRERWESIKRFGKGVAIAGAMALTWYTCSDNYTSRAPMSQGEAAQNEQVTMTRPGSEALDGHILEGLRGQYTGKSGLFVSGEDRTFSDDLRAAWSRKLERATNKDAVRHVIENQVQEYDKTTSEKMSLDAYLGSLEHVFHDARTSTDWDVLQTTEGLEEDELRTVRTALRTVSDKTLGAYAMTELFPQRPGQRELAAKKNEAVFDYAVRNAGTDFVELQPALFDDYLSFGLFMHTSYVVRNDNHVTAASNQMNDVVSADHRVPSSMQYMDDEDHVNAAYGLLAEQFTRLVDDGSPSLLSRLHEASDKDIAMIAAGLHHRPAVTRRHLYGWAETRDELHPEDFGPVAEYARQTAVNYDELNDSSSLRPRSLSAYFSKAFSEEEDGERWTYFDVDGSIDTYPPSRVARLFDQLDVMRGDQYKNTGNLNVVTRQGRLFDGASEMYFKAQRN